MSEEEIKTKVDFVHKTKMGTSKASKPVGMTFNPVEATRKIVNVSRLEWRLKGRQKKGHPPSYEWKEIEVLGSFEGPTAEDSAKQFKDMLATCTPDNGAICVADGLPHAKLAKKRATWEEFEMPL